ncbi:uncharacterized protein DNG_06584 [Cephalotrichum gorgonifer]|uniref:Uncharacterized protein n=1 Tax=Cephalotrichum gorgonifer TaxID=2041049 RepID=A0AAE8SWK9_9PEZI|nr:uncharacterized protein DNG_06584 [Cephalotrichum gorgonifer]
MSSQQSNPTEGHSPAMEPNAPKAKTDKAKKWAAFRAQNYDGEGWGDDYEDRSGSPQSPPHRGVSPSHSPTTVPSDDQPKVSNGLASSLPSQIQTPQITPELGRAAAATAPNPKRASGIYSGLNQLTLSSGPEFSNIAGVEQVPSSAIPQALATVSEDGLHYKLRLHLDPHAFKRNR